MKREGKMITGMTEQMATAKKNVRERMRGYGGKERVIDPFFSPIPVL